MKTLFIFLITMCCFVCSIQAQKPFTELGLDNEVEVITLSNGRYIEHVENDTLRQIGSVMFNMNTNKIEYFIPEDDLEKVRIANRDREVSRFMAVDPLSAKYAYYSPYQFSGNRVIDAVELEGLELKTVKVVIDGWGNGDPYLQNVDVIFLNKEFKTKMNVNGSKAMVDGAITQVIYSYDGEDNYHLEEFKEPLDYGLLDPNFEGLKASARYNYADDEDMALKFKEDWEFILNGKGDLSKLQKIVAIQDRDALAPDAKYENQGLEDVIEAGGYLYFRKYKVKKSDFHPSGGSGIKDKILKDAGGPSRFEHKVGRNPDIKVIDGDKIQLVGRDKFKGKSVTTDLKGENYFK